MHDHAGAGADLGEDRPPLAVAEIPRRREEHVDARVTESVGLDLVDGDLRVADVEQPHAAEVEEKAQVLDRRPPVAAVVEVQDRQTDPGVFHDLALSFRRPAAVHSARQVLEPRQPPHPFHRLRGGDEARVRVGAQVPRHGPRVEVVVVEVRGEHQVDAGERTLGLLEPPALLRRHDRIAVDAVAEERVHQHLGFARRDQETLVREVDHLDAGPWRRRRLPERRRGAGQEPGGENEEAGDRHGSHRIRW